MGIFGNFWNKKIAKMKAEVRQTEIETNENLIMKLLFYVDGTDMSTEESLESFNNIVSKFSLKMKNRKLRAQIETGLITEFSQINTINEIFETHNKNIVKNLQKEAS